MSASPDPTPLADAGAAAGGNRRQCRPGRRRWRECRGAHVTAETKAEIERRLPGANPPSIHDSDGPSLDAWNLAVKFNCAQ